MNDITNVVHGALDLLGRLPRTSVLGYYLPCLRHWLAGNATVSRLLLIISTENLHECNWSGIAEPWNRSAPLIVRQTI